MYKKSIAITDEEIYNLIMKVIEIHVIVSILEENNGLVIKYPLSYLFNVSKKFLRF